MPLDARTLNRPRLPDSAWISSVHTPVQFTTAPARTVTSRPSSTSRTVTPTTRSDSRWKPTTCVDERTTAPYWAAVRATVSVCRASSAWASK